METLQITQKVLSSNYLVHAPPSEEVVMTVRGEKLVEGEKGATLGFLDANFWGTRADMYASDGKSLVGFLVFPFPLSFKSAEARKKLTLHVGDRVYGGGYQVEDHAGVISGGGFRCADEAGEIAIAVTKEMSLTHRFTMQFTSALSPEIAVLVAVSIDRRFFRMQ